ncbi:MAG: hypothetical protein K6B74_03895 [Ruminococcus sp.]|nr:hypothetical protein [Ruminococcus sp.]
MELRADNLLYAAGAGLRNSFRLHITMTETVNGEALEQALNKAARLFPYFAAKLEREGEEYRLADDSLPFNVTNGSRAVTLGSAENNYHLMAAAFEDNSIYLDFSHYITDGQGSFPFLQTLMHSYLSLLHPDENFDTEHMASPENDVAADDPYPEKTLSFDNIGGSKRPEEFFMLNDQPRGYERMNEWTSFCLSVRQKDIVSYISSVDGSPSSFFASLIYRAIDDLHPENELPIVCGMQHTFRKLLGKSHSNRCHVNILPIIYPKRLRRKDVERLNTITRGSVILGSDDANDALTVNRHIMNRERLKEMTLPQKHEYMRRELLDGIGKNTFEVSYTGRVRGAGLTNTSSAFRPISI